MKVNRYDPIIETEYGSDYAYTVMELEPDGDYVRVDDYSYLYDTCLLLASALSFYGNPASYHAMWFHAEAPAGGFADDFSDDHGDDYYNRPMPGELAREALASVRERHPE